MSPLRRRAPASSSDAASGGLPAKVTSRRSARAERALRVELARGVQAWAARAQEDGVTVTEVQPVLQVVGAESSVDFRAGWTRAWVKQGSSYSTGGWPDRLEVGEHGVLLLPLPAGRVGLAAGRHPRVVARPLFLNGRPPQGRDYIDICANALATWLGQPTGNVAPLLAPPVIELIQRGRVARRFVQHFDAQWPLPNADGL